MKCTYDDNSIIAGHIRELLSSFNLPKTKVYTNGQTPYEGRTYIKDGNIVKYQNDQFVAVRPYIYNTEIDNITTTLPVTSSTYDFAAHKYLGNYLRFMRDFNGVDLMPLYNCYANTKATNLNFILDIFVGQSTILVSINTDDNKNNYYLVPAKFGQTYTIGLDALIAYEVFCIIYSGDEVVDLSKKLAKATYKKISGSSFRCPALYSTNINASEYWKYEDQMCLLIKVPKIVQSTISVLEGDYHLHCDTAGCILQPEYVYDDATIDIKNISRLSLLRNNSLVSKPFADRLIEYLLGNPITKLETIGGNISRVLDLIYNEPKYGSTFKGYQGVWDHNIDRRIYLILNYDDKLNFAILVDADVESSELTNKKRRLTYQDEYFDMIGYVDKDVEHILRGL